MPELTELLESHLHRSWQPRGEEKLASVLALFGDGTVALPNTSESISRRLERYLPVMNGIVFLRVVGSSAELAARIEHLYRGAAAAIAPPVRDAGASRRETRHDALEEHVGVELTEWAHARFDAGTSLHVEPEVLTAFAEVVDALAERLERHRVQAAMYEERLAGGGLEFNPATGQVRERSGTGGGRPRSVFPEIAEAVFEGLVTDGLPARNDLQMRSAIRRILGGFFPAEWVDPTPRGHLEESLRNATRPDRGGTAR